MQCTWARVRLDDSSTFAFLLIFLDRCLTSLLPRPLRCSCAMCVTHRSRAFSFLPHASSTKRSNNATTHATRNTANTQHNTQHATRNATQRNACATTPPPPSISSSLASVVYRWREAIIMGEERIGPRLCHQKMVHVAETKTLPPSPERRRAARK